MFLCGATLIMLYCSIGTAVSSIVIDRLRCVTAAVHALPGHHHLQGFAWTLEALWVQLRSLRIRSFCCGRPFLTARLAMLVQKKSSEEMPDWMTATMTIGLVVEWEDRHKSRSQ